MLAGAPTKTLRKAQVNVGIGGTKDDTSIAGRPFTVALNLELGETIEDPRRSSSEVWSGVFNPRPPLNQRISSRIKQAQLPGRALAGKFVEMPVGHTAVHELSETDNIGAHAQTALEEVSQIDSAYGCQAAFLN